MVFENLTGLATTPSIAWLPNVLLNAFIEEVNSPVEHKIEQIKVFSYGQTKSGVKAK